MEFLTFPYMKNALIASLLVGFSCAYLSAFIILRRIVFVGIVLSQLTILGLSVSLYFQLQEGAKLLVGFLFTLAGVLYITSPPYSRKIPADAILGMGFAGFYAFGLLFMAKSTRGLEEIHHLMSGNILSISPFELKVLFISVLVLVFFHVFFYRKFVFISFDPEFARVLGLKVWLWEFLFYLSLGLLISVSIHMVGLNYVFSSLVFPGVIGLILCTSLVPVQLVSIVSALCTAFFGVWFSYSYDFPTAESIISLQAVLFIVVLCLTWFFAKNKEKGNG
ncbi:metal ABC transporter permease [Candidatus Riflebacteria bacterium]